MNMLFKLSGTDYIPWCCGYAEYVPSKKMEGYMSLPVGVQCQFGGEEFAEVALFDTGADWTLIGGETAEILEDQFGEPLENITYKTRLGKFTATLRRLPIKFLADTGCGADLIIDSTVAVAPEWPGPVVLGYYGYMERIYFALEPQYSSESNNLIYFNQIIS